jgi:hypothetical protein
MDLFARVRRRIRAVAALGAVVVLGACGGIAPSGFSGDVEVLLARGQAYTEYLSQRDALKIRDAEVLALGYLERARRGLGSPFRLIEYALRDPDLPEAVRERVAYAILAQVLNGRIYQVDPAVLDVIGLVGVPVGQRSGAAQMELIERTVAAAPSATSGERAVRLGYRLATAERVTERVPHTVVSHVAALVADRRRASEDAHALLRASARAGVDPLELLRRWRRERVFRVERPPLAPLAAVEEVAVARDAPQLASGLRALALRLRAPTSLVGGRDGDPGAPEGFLSPVAAERFLALAKRRDYPAQAPVAVAVSISRSSFLDRPDLRPWEVEARRWFVDAAWNEERLVAATTLLRGSGAGRGVRLPLMEVQAATFLRAWNQEEPWYPGDPAPAVRDVVGRFGLADVVFDAEVPERWRPYYLRMLARGLADLQRVLPTASVRGLRVRIGPLAEGVEALALHDPRSRTLHLPPRTGAGTLAHEVAHDLDWQLARRRYARRGGYATDLAVKYQRGDRIAASVVGLADAIRPPEGTSGTDPHDVRPAEVFARGTDWFVAAALAREGRTDGYLSSFQDPALTGYGTTRGPDVGGGAVPALLAILDAIAPVEEAIRSWALESYGPTRTLSPMEVASAVLDAGRELPPEERLAAVASAGDRSLEILSSAGCRLTPTPETRRLLTAKRELIRRSARAAARGAAIDAIHELARRELGTGASPRVERWLGWRLYGVPEAVDSAVYALTPAFEDLLYRAEHLVREAEVPFGSAFRTPGGASLCGGNPFARGLRVRGSLPGAPIGGRTWPAPGIGGQLGDLRAPG